MELQWLISTLNLLLAGGLGGVANYIIVEHWPWAQALAPRRKREVALTVAVALGVGLKLLLIWLTADYPASGQEWLAVLVAAGALAAGVGQLSHGERRLT
jgi:hypothetical protein